MSTETIPKRKTLPIDIEDFKTLIDAVDTRYGHDAIVSDLVTVLDGMVETLENHGRVYRRRKHQRAGASGFRNVHWNKRAQKWEGRIGWTDAKGKRHRRSAGYYAEAEVASAAVEELRKELGLP